MILTGDCVEQMAALEPSSVDAIVTDPPYGLEFMGKEWDGANGFRRSLNPTDVGRDDPFGRTSRTSPEYRAGRVFQEWSELWAREALRVLKPGGHLLAFGGTRTYHRLACAIEDAGFEIRDSLVWMTGQGFPKSLDVSKAIDKAAGAEREVVGYKESIGYPDGDGVAMYANRAKSEGSQVATEGMPEITAPATPEAEKWQGWGTALKPAHEPIVVARKPLTGTVAQNVLEHGTGALNIDGTRIGYDGKADQASAKPGGRATAKVGALAGGTQNDATRSDFEADNTKGRWPANVLLDEQAAAELDEQTGESTSTIGKPRSGQNGEGWGMSATGAEYDDQGGASRFFYCAKTSRAERNAGLGGFEVKPLNWSSGEQSPGTFQADGTERASPNNHPTVKPINLMRWLVRLITPPGGTVLDPFLGSGTTGIAAVLEGSDFIGIEREAEYVAIAEARIAFWEPHAGREVEDVLRVNGSSEAERERLTAMGQGGLF